MVVRSRILLGKPESRKHLGNPGREDKIILKRFLRI